MTTLVQPDVRDVLNNANLNQTAEALSKIKFGNMCSRVKVVAASLTAAASFDITTAAVKAASTITGITLDTGEQLPPIGCAASVRVTASGTAGSVGVYVVGDVDATLLIPGTANGIPGVCRLSDDGKTLTFPNTVTAFTIVYTPGALGGANQAWTISAP